MPNIWAFTFVKTATFCKTKQNPFHLGVLWFHLFLLYVIEFKRLFYGFDYFSDCVLVEWIEIPMSKSSCFQSCFFSSVKWILGEKKIYNFNIDFLILLQKNWLINFIFADIRITFHSMGWSISNVSIFIYLLCFSVTAAWYAFYSKWYGQNKKKQIIKS